MIVQLSSGMGPYECELAVTGIFNALKKEFPDIHKYYSHKSKSNNKGCTSILFTTNEDLSFLDGTIQWICQSPIRSNYECKNWFIDVNIIKEKDVYNIRDVKFRTFKTNRYNKQNKIQESSGVEAIHIPTRLRALCADEHSQYLNKQRALEKLNALIQVKEADISRNHNKKILNEYSDTAHKNIIRVYKGLDFKLVG